MYPSVRINWKVFPSTLEVRRFANCSTYRIGDDLTFHLLVSCQDRQQEHYCPQQRRQRQLRDTFPVISVNVR